MIASDVLIVIGRFFPSVVLSSIPDFEFDDIICKAFSGIFFFGRAGTSVSVVLLAIERNAALSFPNRQVLITTSLLNTAFGSEWE